MVTITTSTKLPWFENIKPSLTINARNRDYVEYLYDLFWLSSRVQRWLNEMHVSGNAEAEAIVRQLHEFYYLVCNWRHLDRAGSSEAFNEIRAAACRLSGLVAGFSISDEDE